MDINKPISDPQIWVNIFEYHDASISECNAVYECNNPAEIYYFSISAGTSAFSFISVLSAFSALSMGVFLEA